MANKYRITMGNRSFTESGETPQEAIQELMRKMKKEVEIKVVQKQLANLQTELLYVDGKKASKSSVQYYYITSKISQNTQNKDENSKKEYEEKKQKIMYIVNKLYACHKTLSELVKLKFNTNALIVANSDIQRYLRSLDADSTSNTTLSDRIKKEGVLGVAKSVKETLLRCSDRAEKYKLSEERPEDYGIAIITSGLRGVDLDSIIYNEIDKFNRVVKEHEETKELIIENKASNQKKQIVLDSFRNKGLNIDIETYYASLKFQLGDDLYCDINNDNGTFMLVDKVRSYVVKSGHIDYNKKNDIANIILKSKADYLNEKKVKESTYVTTIEQVKSSIDKIKGNWLNTPIRGSEPDAPYGWQVANNKDKYIVFLSKKKPWVLKYKNGTISEGKATFDDNPTTQYELEEWLREKAHEINYYCVH